MTHVYTDGACKGNPGIGGWGWVQYSKLKSGAKITFEDFGGEKYTTNNRMELTAVIEFLKNAPIGEKYVIHSDSLSYVLKGLVQGGNGTLKNVGEYSGWMGGWKKKNFTRVKNVGLWRMLDAWIQNHLIDGSVLEFCYVKAHSGDPGNDRADELANMGCKIITNSQK